MECGGPYFWLPALAGLGAGVNRRVNAAELPTDLEAGVNRG
jgi:hypothetical protein